MNARTRTGVLRDERGVAIIAALGAVVLVTIVAIGAFTLASQSFLTASKTQEEAQAFQTANAGLEAVLADCDTNGADPALAHYPVTRTVGRGTYTASLTALGGFEYRAVSTGRFGHARETITQTFFWLSIWNMNLAGVTGVPMSGGNFNGNSLIRGPFFCRGSLGLNSAYEEGPLFVKAGGTPWTPGNLTTNVGHADVGTPTTPVALYVEGAVIPGNGTIYQKSLTHNVPDLTLPPLAASYMNENWAVAKAQSVDNKMGSKDTTNNLEASGNDPATYTTIDPPNTAWTRSKAAGASTHYKYIGPVGGPSAIGQGATALTIGATSFGSWWGDGHYTLANSHDDFAYDAATRTLYIEGTVLVDGPVTINDVKYVGNGKLIANGDIVLTGGFHPANAAQTLAPLATAGLVTPTTITINGVGGNPTFGDPPPYCGAFYAMNKVIMQNQGMLIEGSLIAGAIIADNNNDHLYTNPLLPSYLPAGMPGAGRALVNRGNWARR